MSTVISPRACSWRAEILRPGRRQQLYILDQVSDVSEDLKYKVVIIKVAVLRALWSSFYSTDFADILNIGYLDHAEDDFEIKKISTFFSHQGRIWRCKSKNNNKN